MRRKIGWQVFPFFALFVCLLVLYQPFMEFAKILKHICRSSYPYLLCIKQYIHGLAAHGIHYLHRPGPILQDAGFFLLPVRMLSRVYWDASIFNAAALSCCLLCIFFLLY